MSAALQGPSPILWTGLNAPARIVPTVTTSVAAPSVSFSWQCTGFTSAQVTSDGGVLDFVVPRVTGPGLVASCQVTATGAPPLTPTTQTATVGFVIRDVEDPVVRSTRPSFTRARSSPFGFILKASEPVTTPSVLTCSARAVEREGPALLFFSSTLLTPQLCPAWTMQLNDFAPNIVSGVMLAPAFTTTPQFEGPFVSTASFDDPQPALASAGVLPFETQAAANPPMNPPRPYALVARDGTSLAQFTLDALNTPSPCAPDCVLPSTSTPLAGLSAAAPSVIGTRVVNVGAELLVAMHESSPGITYARRSLNGTWSTLTVDGELHTAGNQARRVRVADGGVVSDVFDPVTSSFGAAEFVTSMPGDGGQLGLGDTRFGSRAPLVSVFKSGTITTFQRSAATAVWTPLVLSGATDVVSFRPAEDTSVFSYGVVVARTTVPHLVFYDGNGTPRVINTLGPVLKGFDVLQRGESHVIAVSQNGDLRLYADILTNSMRPLVGPTRAVPLAPGDNRFDVDVSCEAAWPRLAFVEDALVVTWQERCAPATTWRVIARVVH